MNGNDLAAGLKVTRAGKLELNGLPVVGVHKLTLVRRQSSAAAERLGIKGVQSMDARTVLVFLVESRIQG